MRDYVPCWDKIGISRDRYLELLRFCRQYKSWKHDAAHLLGLQSHAGDGQPHGSGISDPTARAAERREMLLAKIEIVEQCATLAGGGKWFMALIENVCNNKAYIEIERKFLPTSNRNQFFKARREFFILLNEMRG